MSPRAIRRAAERKAAKFAAKAGSTAAVAAQPPQSVPAVEPATTTQAAKVMTASVGETDEIGDFIAAALDAIPPTANEPWAVSNARLAANRANAQKSTGPASTEGKATSSKNALKTGLTGATVLLPNDDAIIYQAFVESIFEQYTPATDQENRLTQLIADTEWRIHRIAPLEAGIFAVARIEQPDWFFSETNKNANSSGTPKSSFSMKNRSVTSRCRNAASAVSTKTTSPHSNNSNKTASKNRSKPNKPSSTNAKPSSTAPSKSLTIA